jgi:hypothetical protein
VRHGSRGKSDGYGHQRENPAGLKIYFLFWLGRTAYCLITRKMRTSSIQGTNMEVYGATMLLDSRADAPEMRPLAYYVGRLEAFHTVLDFAAPGQPAFSDLNLTPDDPIAQWEAALQAVYRRLGSAVSKLTLLQRERLRDAVMEISRRDAQCAPDESPRDPVYQRAILATYRQIIAAIDMRASSEGWLV